MDDPTTQLEEKLAFLERHVEELDSVVREIHDKMELIGRDLLRLRQDTQQQFQSLDQSPEADEPPHWGRS